MTTEETEATSTTQATECRVCHHQFDSIQEALKHELLNHSASKNSKKLPVNKLKRRVNAVLKTIKSEDEKKFRQDLAEAISDCACGTEFNVIFKKYKMDDENLNFIYSKIHCCLEKELEKVGEFSIEPYGSVATGLALKTSDFDLYISRKTSGVHPKVTYKNITKMLFRSKCFSDIVPIRAARVPIIKCVHKGTGFSLDINTCEPYGVHNSRFIHEINRSDTRIHKLMLFLKIWSKSMHIHGAFNMTNYCLITLVIFYLQNTEPQILPSIKILQRKEQKRIINGINFEINSRGIPLDSSQDIHQLIKGFFKFYSDFDFKTSIIAPYLGKAINRADFQSKTFKYPEYDMQLRMFAKNNDVQELKTDRPVCVQDMFCLNVNVGNCLTEHNVQYFTKCVTLAHRKCLEPSRSHKELYKSLLVEIIEEITELLPEDTPEVSTNMDTMAFDIIPRKIEIKSLSKFADNPLDVQKLWAKEYIDAICQIITEVYRIDMRLMSPTQNCKFKKIDEASEDKALLPTSWSISCYVDLWSKRQMHRNSTSSFMDYQLAQTEKLNAERRQNSNYAVQFKGYLTISIISNYSALHVEAGSTETLGKKDPLRKFFGVLKCSMQNYNLKQRIHELETQAKEQPMLLV